MTSVAAVVQARSSSRRLPGKVLLRAGGRTLLEWVVGRLRGSQRISPVVVATSQEASDDTVAAEAERLGVACHRGPLEDVAARFAEAVRRYTLPAFVRICADSPLIDPAPIEEGIARFSSGEYGLVTNLQRRTFPKGQSFEIFRSGDFLAGCGRMADASDREHVTPWFYRNAARIRILNIESGEEAGGVNLCVDTQEDYDRFLRFLRRAGPGADRLGWRQIVRIYGDLERGVEERRGGVS